MDKLYGKDPFKEAYEAQKAENEILREYILKNLPGGGVINALANGLNGDDIIDNILAQSNKHLDGREDCPWKCTVDDKKCVCSTKTSDN